MMFHVTISRLKNPPRNPFVAGSILRREETLVREWEMDCESEDEVRQFFRDAKEQDLPNVRGFQLRSIEPIRNQTTEGSANADL